MGVGGSYRQASHALHQHAQITPFLSFPFPPTASLAVVNQLIKVHASAAML